MPGIRASCGSRRYRPTGALSARAKRGDQIAAGGRDSGGVLAVTTNGAHTFVGIVMDMRRRERLGANKQREPKQPKTEQTPVV